jgi:hypothetical protein
VYYDGILTSTINLDALRLNITIIPQIVSPSSVFLPPLSHSTRLLLVARIIDRLAAGES